MRPGPTPALKRGARLHLSVVRAVSDVVAANAGRLDAATREGLARVIAPAADEKDSIDAPAWTRALAALETAAPDDRKNSCPALQRWGSRPGRMARTWP